MVRNSMNTMFDYNNVKTNQISACRAFSESAKKKKYIHTMDRFTFQMGFVVCACVFVLKFFWIILYCACPFDFCFTITAVAFVCGW